MARFALRSSSVASLLDLLLSKDRPALRRALRALPAPIERLDALPDGLREKFERSIATRAKRREGLPKPTFPDDLPVNQRRDEIALAIRDHQVVIICGETGSGKTTQIPKICLELGRGEAGLIGHTQPRRIAARATAARIAEELGSELGSTVGYKIRFTDQTKPESYIKLMTDGILLAETQGDPLLSAYDTLIIDEAHERSLNIDFLLGYLSTLLQKRRDMKLIVTSATLDAERFANHFAINGKPAPVIEVSGRLYPIEVRYRPIEDEVRPGFVAQQTQRERELAAQRAARRQDKDLYEAIVDAVDELQREGPGDVLVFLPGEREIREAAEALRKHHAPGTEILTLFARQSAQEQQRVFGRSNGRRVVLSTNVAETSLTVPGIRYVVDAGLARMNRYSVRNKVELLQVEKIAQSAAKQRAGRCGRVQDGICIRLYDEEDFNKRLAHTEPEILRSSLAGVILRMKSLHLGAVEAFPFIDAPTPRAIGDGYQLLNELGAVDDDNELTPIGKELAKLPLDPKIGRMLLAARDRGCLDEVLVIAAALSTQDPRDRPPEQTGTADQAHAKFRMPRSDKPEQFGEDKNEARSEFLWYVNLWNVADEVWKHEGSSKQKAWCKQNFLSWLRMREWRDVHGQLHSLCAEHGWLRAEVSDKSVISASSDKRAGTQRRSGQEAKTLDSRSVSTTRGNDGGGAKNVPHHALAAAASKAKTNEAERQYEAIHKALLTGLLGHIGVKQEETVGQNAGAYLGARAIRFWPHPSSYLAKKAGKWLMAAELIDTSRLYARCIARIEPEWIEEVGGHLVKKQVYEPHWEKKHGAVRAYERGVLYGLTLYARRPVAYSDIDPAMCREIFIREALVEGDLEDAHAKAMPFFQHNERLMTEIERLEHKMRRPDLLVDKSLIEAFYDAQIPAEVTDVRSFEVWRKKAEREQPRLLHLEREQLMRHEAAGVTSDNFPASLTVLGQKLKLTYVHEPRDPEDGVTLTVPLAMLNQVPINRCEWLVPGLLEEKVVGLMKTVPPKHRHRLQPISESGREFMVAFNEKKFVTDEPLLRGLQTFVEERVQLKLPLESFRAENLNPHCFMNFRVIDEHGRVLGQSRNLMDLRLRFKDQVLAAFRAGQVEGSLGAQLAGLSIKPAAAKSETERGFSPLPAQSATLPLGGGNGNVRASVESKALAQQSPLPEGEGGPLGRERGGSSQTAVLEKLTTWSFGELPELLEVKVGSRTLIGFPALHDDGNSVSLRPFDTEEEATRMHRKGLARLFALTLKDQVKNIERLPGLRDLALKFLPFGNEADLKAQLVEATLTRTCLLPPWPTDAESFAKRTLEAKPRISLVAQELMRLVGSLLTEHAAVTKKLVGLKNAADLTADIQAQLERLMPKDFLMANPYERIAHFPRYLKAAATRVDKWRNDPARDAQLIGEWRSVATPFEREHLAKLKANVVDPQLEEFRWQLEELRVSLFAQELKTPVPVSAKRLQKVWAGRPR
ncbi:ATP-dependent RNA helicase HrpA [Uliginosibacterium sp. H3]|uniref:ATP-dependent RNA helicase HrpA n=1 Tax=Uliginosibacterium silvisoli TaxID=3114758 RepID=A0ABU6K9J2_9RHOO|nr:ATP-dependent RNA helicase HrpA [Uliginosibacterium sp. H3]